MSEWGRLPLLLALRSYLVHKQPLGDKVSMGPLCVEATRPCPTPATSYLCSSPSLSSSSQERLVKQPLETVQAPDNVAANSVILAYPLGPGRTNYLLKGWLLAALALGWWEGPRRVQGNAPGFLQNCCSETGTTSGARRPPHPALPLPAPSHTLAPDGL